MPPCSYLSLPQGKRCPPVPADGPGGRQGDVARRAAAAQAAACGLEARAEAAAAAACTGSPRITEMARRLRRSLADLAAWCASPAACLTSRSLTPAPTASCSLQAASGSGRAFTRTQTMQQILRTDRACQALQACLHPGAGVPAVAQPGHPVRL